MSPISNTSLSRTTFQGKIFFLHLIFTRLQIHGFSGGSIFWFKQEMCFFTKALRKILFLKLKIKYIQLKQSNHEVLFILCKFFYSLSVSFHIFFLTVV